MSRSHRIKGKNNDEAFQGQCFVWERGATFGFLTFKIFYILHLTSLHPHTSLHKNLFNKQKERQKRKKKHDRSPLKHPQVGGAPWEIFPCVPTGSRIATVQLLLMQVLHIEVISNWLFRLLSYIGHLSD